MTHLEGKALKPFRRRAQIIFQDPLVRSTRVPRLAMRLRKVCACTVSTTRTSDWPG